jgi:hypothetical protein
MIIFGRKAKCIGHTRVEGDCTHCNQAQLVAFIYQKYFHIFWIPTIPYGKTTMLQCQNCKNALDEKEQSPFQKSLTRPALKSTKTPVYHFAGLFLIICLMGWSMYSSEKEKARTQTLIASPAADDVAVMQSSDHEFIIVKLVSIGGEAVALQVGNYVYPNELSAKQAITRDKIKESDFFNNDTFELPISQYTQAKIKYVDRNPL